MLNKTAVSVISLLALLFLCSCSSKESHDDALEEWLRQYNCSFDISSIATENKATAYKCVTEDTRKIEFTVTCRDGYAEIPFAFRLPVREVKADDDFAVAVEEWLSASLEPVDAGDYAVDDIVDMILKEMDRAEELFTEYGIKGETPTLHFRITRNGKEHDFCCGNHVRQMVRDSLVKELYT